MSRRLLLLFVTVPLLLGARVYQNVEPDGSVSYTDRPSPGAKEVEMLPLPTYQAPAVPSPAEDAAVKEAPFRYTSFAIERPRSEEALRQNVGNVDVEMLLKPPLQESMAHSIVVFVDGMPVLKNETSSRVQLTNIDRGRHTLQASVVDADGKELIRAAPVAFDLQRRRTQTRGPLPPQKPFTPFKPLPPH